MRSGQLIAVLSVVFALVSPGFVYASCSWSGASPSFSANNPITFETSGYRILANKNWYDDGRFPIGTFMGKDTVTLKAQNCNSLTELKGQHVDVVYVPPVNAVRSGAGYRIPASAAGVAMDIEFPNGSAHPGGVLLGTSVGVVSNGGSMSATGSRIPPVTVTLSVVKTGTFVSGTDTAVKFDGGLGSFRYYSSADATLSSASEDQLRMPDRYSSTKLGDYLGQASAPICHVNKLGDVSLASGPKVITMPVVSTADFSAAGAIDKGAKSQQFTFTCLGTSNTKPTVYFEATYPFNSGVEGVGLPADRTDIGIQILLNNSPIKFGQNSPVLGWNVVPLTSGIRDVIYGFLSPQGFYCKTNCGTDMSNANWVDGGAGSGNNDGFDAAVTFKYYQTTSQSPKPGSFSVPFTITLDVQ